MQTKQSYKNLYKLIYGKRKYIRKKRRRRGRPGLRESVFNSTIRIYNYSLNISESSQFPLILRFGAMILASSRALQLATMFQQYKLNWMKVRVIPVVLNGTTPTPLYALSGMDREISPTPNVILESGKCLTNKRDSTVNVRSTGRQNDFNYWFDCNKIGQADLRPTVQVAFAVDELAGKQGKYDFQVLVNLSFRYPQYETPPFNIKGHIKDQAGVLAGVKMENNSQASDFKEDDQEEIKEDKEEEIKEEIGELEKKLEELRMKLKEF